VKAHGLRVYRGALVVPVHDAGGVMHGLQCIGASGAKRFLKGGRFQGRHYRIDGDVSESNAGGGNTGDAICIAEGFAIGASLREATGHAVAVGFHAGNLEAVDRSIRETHSQVRIAVCADDDHVTPGNRGATHAHPAARAIGGFPAPRRSDPRRLARRATSTTCTGRWGC